MNELYHYGIPGQRHGRRRFQNRDGSLTPAGRARYLRGRRSSGSPKGQSTPAVGMPGLSYAKLQNARNIVGAWPGDKIKSQTDPEKKRLSGANDVVRRLNIDKRSELRSILRNDKWRPSALESSFVDRLSTSKSQSFLELIGYPANPKGRASTMEEVGINKLRRREFDVKNGEAFFVPTSNVESRGVSFVDRIIRRFY